MLEDGVMTDKRVEIALDVQSQSQPGAHACAVCGHAGPAYSDQISLTSVS